MKKPLFLLIFLSFFFSREGLNAQQHGPTTEKVLIYKQVKIPFEGTIELQEVLNLGIEPLGIKNNFVECILSEVELEIISNKGVQFEVVIEDMQKDFIKRNKDNKSQYKDKMNPECGGEGTVIDYPTPTNFELGSMGGYFTLEEVYAEFEEMNNLYPNLISAMEPISDFETFQGRNLYIARLSDNPNIDEDEPEILYTAIHHAREPESISQLIFYVWYLLENYDTDPEVQTILNNTELYILPLVNPDGYNYNATTNPDGGGFWRKNRRDHGDGTFGVDPNRNYGVEWGTEGISFDTNSDVYCGTEAFSEPENQAVKWLCENHEFRMALNNHTYSELLLYPYGYALEQYTEDDQYFEVISAQMVSQNGYTDQLSSLLYAASGDSDDWMYDATDEKPKIFAFTPEIGYAFWPVSSDIIPIAKEMVFLNLTASHLVTDYAIAKDMSPFSVNTLTPNAEFTIQSLGLDLTNSFTVSLEAVSDNISSVGSSITYTNMATMAEENGVISYTLDGSISSGDVIEYKIMVDQGGYSVAEFVSKIYGQSTAVFTDEAVNLDNWSSDSWGITTTTYYSDPSSITDSPNGDYQNFEYNTLELDNTIDLSNALSANITFYAKWNIENNYDYVQLIVNGDAQCGLYTNTGTNAQEEGDPLYDGVQIDWVEEYIDLSDYLGETISVSFRFVSDGGVTEDGFYFDDFKINVTGTVAITELETNIIGLTCSPNPGVDQVTFTLNQPILNNNSRLILTNELGQEITRTSFDSKTITLDVSTLSEGVYFYSYQDEKIKSESKKLIIIR